MITALHASPRWIILATLMLHSSAVPQSGTPTPQQLTAAATLYYWGQNATLIRDWCLKVAPQHKTTVQQGFNEWRATFNLSNVDQFIQQHMPKIIPATKQEVEKNRQKYYDLLGKDSRDPAADCLNFQKIMLDNFNLAKRFPNEYAQIKNLQAAPPTTGTPPSTAPSPTQPTPPSGSTTGGGPFIQNTNFNPFYKAYILKRLTQLGGVSPFTAGGPLHAGAYKCQREELDDSSDKVRQITYTLNLFGDLGVRVTDGLLPSQYSENKSPMKELEGTFKYDPKTGNIEVNADSRNDYLEDLTPGNGWYDDISRKETIFNIFRLIRDSKGLVMVYGQQSFGSGDDSQTICKYVGAPKMKSPVAIQNAKDAEEERIFNLYRTKPDQGLKLNQIEAVRHDYQTRTEGINMIGEETTYLLLKDGSVYLNLRWTPHDLDVAASKKGEPKNWSKWKTENGKDMLLRDGKWIPFPGFRAVIPLVNEPLSGTFGYYSGYTAGLIGLGTTVTTQKYITFTGNKFKQIGWSQMAGVLDNGASVTTSSGYSGDKDKQGTYTLKGLTLEKRFDNGAVTRTYAYWWDKKKDKLIIAGTSWDKD